MQKITEKCALLAVTALEKCRQKQREHTCNFLTRMYHVEMAQEFAISGPMHEISGPQSPVHLRESPVRVRYGYFLRVWQAE